MTIINYVSRFLSQLCVQVVEISHSRDKIYPFFIRDNVGARIEVKVSE